MSRARGGSSPGAQLQRGGRRVRADVVHADGSAAQAGRVAARVGAGLPGVRSRIWLLEEGFGQDFFPPRAGLGVHDRVEERLEVRIQVLGYVDHLLPWRGRDSSGIHFPNLRRRSCLARRSPCKGGDRSRSESKRAGQDPALPSPKKYSVRSWATRLVFLEEGQSAPNRSRSSFQAVSQAKLLRTFPPPSKGPGRCSTPRQPSPNCSFISRDLQERTDEARPSQAPTESYATFPPTPTPEICCNSPLTKKKSSFAERRREKFSGRSSHGRGGEEGGQTLWPCLNSKGA